MGNLLYKVEHGNSVPDRGEENSAIWAKEKVSFAVNSSKQIGKLEIGFHCHQAAMPQGRQGIRLLDRSDLFVRGSRRTLVDKYKFGGLRGILSW